MAWNKTLCRKIRRRKGGRRGWQQLSQLQPDDSVAPGWHLTPAVTCLAVYWHTVSWLFILGNKNLQAFYCQVLSTGSINLLSSMSSPSRHMLFYLQKPIIDARYIWKCCKAKTHYPKTASLDVREPGMLIYIKSSKSTLFFVFESSRNHVIIKPVWIEWLLVLFLQVIWLLCITFHR